MITNGSNPVQSSRYNELMLTSRLTDSAPTDAMVVISIKVQLHVNGWWGEHYLESSYAR